MQTPYCFHAPRRTLLALGLIGVTSWAGAQNVPTASPASVGLTAAAPSGGSASMPVAPATSLASTVSPAMAPSRSASGAARSGHPGLLGALEQTKGRLLAVNERQTVHDALRDTVESWRKTQAEFSAEAAALLRTTPELIDSTLPRKGWHRVGATRDAGWIPRLEKALNRKVTPDERHKLEHLDDAKHAKVWAAREQASARIAKALGLTPAAVDAAWPWPAHPALTLPSPLPASSPAATGAPVPSLKTTP